MDFICAIFFISILYICITYYMNTKMNGPHSVKRPRDQKIDEIIKSIIREDSTLNCMIGDRYDIMYYEFIKPNYFVRIKNDLGEFSWKIFMDAQEKPHFDMFKKIEPNEELWTF